MITGLPSPLDVIPTGFLFAWETWSTEALSLRSWDLRAPACEAGKKSQFSQCQAPLLSLDRSETAGTLRDITAWTDQTGRGCGEDEGQLQVRRQGRDHPSAPGEGRGPPPASPGASPAPSLRAVPPHSVFPPENDSIVLCVELPF